MKQTGCTSLSRKGALLTCGAYARPHNNRVGRVRDAAAPRDSGEDTASRRRALRLIGDAVMAAENGSPYLNEPFPLTENIE